MQRIIGGVVLLLAVLFEPVRGLIALVVVAIFGVGLLIALAALIGSPGFLLGLLLGISLGGESLLRMICFWLV